MQVSYLSLQDYFDSITMLFQSTHVQLPEQPYIVTSIRHMQEQRSCTHVSEEHNGPHQQHHRFPASQPTVQTPNPPKRPDTTNAIQSSDQLIQPHHQFDLINHKTLAP
jgi:hypothetical protein